MVENFDCCYQISCYSIEIDSLSFLYENLFKVLNLYLKKNYYNSIIITYYNIVVTLNFIFNWKFRKFYLLLNLFIYLSVIVYC